MTVVIGLMIYLAGVVSFPLGVVLLLRASKRTNQETPDRGSPDAKEPVLEQVTAVLRTPRGARTIQ